MHYNMNRVVDRNKQKSRKNANRAMDWILANVPHDHTPTWSLVAKSIGVRDSAKLIKAVLRSERIGRVGHTSWGIISDIEIDGVCFSGPRYDPDRPKAGAGGKFVARVKAKKAPEPVVKKQRGLAYAQGTPERCLPTAAELAAYVERRYAHLMHDQEENNEDGTSRDALCGRRHYGYGGRVPASA